MKKMFSFLEPFQNLVNLDTDSSGVNFDILISFLAEVKSHNHTDIKSVAENYGLEADKIRLVLQLLKPSLDKKERSLKITFTKIIDKLNKVTKDRDNSPNNEDSDDGDPDNAMEH